MQKGTKRKLVGGSLALAMAFTSAFTPAIAYAAPQSSYAVVEKAMGRIDGTNRYETAAKIAQVGWNESEYAVLSAGMDANLVDSLTAAPLAKLKDAPILLTEGNKLNSYAEAELKRLGVKTVYVTSGSGVITQNVINKLKFLEIEVKSLGGANRFETAVNIAKELPAPTEIAVSTGFSNADALSMASIAASKGMPILLTDDASLPANVKTYIDSIKADIDTTYVLGGTSAVNTSVQNSLPNSVRLGGIDRFDTNRMILEAFAKDIQNSTYYVANGTDKHLVDALAVSPLAAQSTTPVVLTNTQMPKATQEFVLLNLNTDKVIALGGVTVVPQAIMDNLKAKTILAEDGATVGSEDAAQLEFFESVKITGDNVTLKNAKVAQSVYIQGDNVTLENVEVAGTVFIDPGEEGSADLKGVTANNIVVLSGGENSIHLVVKANFLKVQSAKSVRVETKGDTQIGSTVISSSAILDAVSGSVGDVEVTGSAAEEQVVEFRGKIGDVIVTGQVAVKAGVGAEITNLVIAATGNNKAVKLEGNFGKVIVNKAVEVVLGANTTVKNIVTNVKTDITLSDSTSKVESITDAGKTGSEVKTSDGKTVDVPKTDSEGSTGNTGGSGGSGDNNNGQNPGETVVAPKIESDGLPKYLQLIEGEKGNTISFITPYNGVRDTTFSVNRTCDIQIVSGEGSLGKWTLKKGENNLVSEDALEALNVERISTILEKSKEDISTFVNFEALFKEINNVNLENEDDYQELLEILMDMTDGNQLAMLEAAKIDPVQMQEILDEFVRTKDMKAAIKAVYSDKAKVAKLIEGIDYEKMQTVLKKAANEKPAIFYEGAVDIAKILLESTVNQTTENNIRNAIHFTDLLEAISENSGDLVIKLTADGKTTQYTVDFK